MRVTEEDLTYFKSMADLVADGNLSNMIYLAVDNLDCSKNKQKISTHAVVGTPTSNHPIVDGRD